VSSDTPEPAPLTESATLRLIGVGRVLQQRFEAELAKLGLTMRHLGALGHLSRHPDMSYSDLARRSRVTSQSMNATVRTLEEMGAVQRSLEGHGRAARLEITDKGRELLDGARQAASSVDSALATELGHDELANLLASISRLTLLDRPPQP